MDEELEIIKIHSMDIVDEEKWIKFNSKIHLLKCVELLKSGKDFLVDDDETLEFIPSKYVWELVCSGVLGLIKIEDND